MEFNLIYQQPTLWIVVAGEYFNTPEGLKSPFSRELFLLFISFGKFFLPNFVCIWYVSK